jgi:hypothetical protein
MFRAELGNGYRDRAVALLARLRERYIHILCFVWLELTFLKTIPRRSM